MPEERNLPGVEVIDEILDLISDGHKYRDLDASDGTSHVQAEIEGLKRAVLLLAREDMTNRIVKGQPPEDARVFFDAVMGSLHTPIKEEK